MALVDPELVQQAQNGDRLAYGHLVEMVMPRLRAVVGGVLGNSSEADDCIQEALLSGWKHLGRLRERKSIFGLDGANCPQ